MKLFRCIIVVMAAIVLFLSVCANCEAVSEGEKNSLNRLYFISEFISKYAKRVNLPDPPIIIGNYLCWIILYGIDNSEMETEILGAVDGVNTMCYDRLSVKYNNETIRSISASFSIDFDNKSDEQQKNNFYKTCAFFATFEHGDPLDKGDGNAITPSDFADIVHEMTDIYVTFISALQEISGNQFEGEIIEKENETLYKFYNGKTCSFYICITESDDIFLYAM